MNSRAIALAFAGTALAAGVGYWAWQRLEPLPAQSWTEPPPARVVGFRLHVERTGEHSFTFSRAELEAALKDPYQLTYLGRLAAAPSGDGVQVVAAPLGSLTQRLGFQAGDVIRSVNGERVATPRDLAGIYRRFYHLPGVRGEVRRGARVLTFSYQVRG